MSKPLYETLLKLQDERDIACITDITHGVEKESLRVDSSGHIALSPHPSGLGSALAHSSITTDFSEALLEFITPVYKNPDDSIAYLEDLHTWTYQQMPAEELLWTSSMPCIIGKDEDIPLAQYGSSNIGQLKTLYRKGLGFRYGRTMQTIAGIHYNFSLSEDFWSLYREIKDSDLSLQDFKTEQYFSLIRNFRRYSWILLYLYGASPALCKSFISKHSNHGLDEYDEHSLYGPYATSLRMGDLGYTSKAQASLYISYNNLSEYADGLLKAIKTPYKPYEKFQTNDGSPAQLNANILQIENEFYSTIRPKRVSTAGIRPVRMLKQDGVEYIEVRCLDLNPFLPVGIDQEQMHFLNAFLIFCLLKPSPLSDCDESHQIEANLRAVVLKGRDPDLTLLKGAQKPKLRDWAQEIMKEVMDVAELLDGVGRTEHYRSAVKSQRAKVEDDSLTPSAIVLQRMKEVKTPYFKFAMNQSLANSDFFRGRQLTESKVQALELMTQASLQTQKDIEATDDTDFATYLKFANES